MKPDTETGLERIVGRRRLTRKQARMRRAVKALQAFIADYHTQDGYLNYSDETLIDDVLYGLGTALDHEKHSWANGYDIFKAQLREHLGPPPNARVKRPRAEGAEMNTKECPRGPLEPIVGRRQGKSRRKLSKRQQRMADAVTSLADFMADYDTQHGYLDYSDETLIDDVLYGLGIALDPERHAWANGYELFKARLREHLGTPPNAELSGGGTPSA